jgi:hypothetical protein
VAERLTDHRFRSRLVRMTILEVTCGGINQQGAKSSN